MSEVDNSEAAIIAKEVNAQFMQPQNAGLVSFLEVHISHEVIPLAVFICSALFVQKKGGASLIEVLIFSINLFLSCNTVTYRCCKNEIQHCSTICRIWIQVLAEKGQIV